MLNFDKTILVMKTICSILVLVLFLSACTQSKTKHITEFSQNDIKNGILVDVRTPMEFNAGHLDNAVNINFLEKGFVSAFDSIAKNRTIFVYCKKGGRSAKAAQLLDSLGYKKVVDLLGGYDALVGE